MSRGKVVLLGMMSKMPVAGVVWQAMHYLEGFERLGFEAHYVEAHARTPGSFVTRDDADGSNGAARFIRETLDRFGFPMGRWAFQALHSDGRVLGLTDSQLERLYLEAALIVNLHGGTEPRPEHYRTGRLVYIETDPVLLQLELLGNNRATLDFLEPHSAFFTFAENLGRDDCLLPIAGPFEFVSTRQPVVLDHWTIANGSPRDVFTTIGNWMQPWRDVQYRGETYGWSKRDEFMKLLDLPARSRVALELALSSLPRADRATLESHGWCVVDAAPVSHDPIVYRDYICASRGEFTVAKDQNVRLRTGWFSDRSATYLAAGRPVVTQDTGFSSALPTGEGLFAFNGVVDAVAAIDSVLRDYPAHSAKALQIANDFFAAEVVLGELTQTLGL
jgi:hypothetical protein